MSQQTPATFRSRSFGIKHKLFAAFGAVAAMTVAASAVGWLSFADAGRTMHDVTSRNVPAMRASLELARVSAEVAAVAPALAAASDDAARKQVLSGLQAKEAAMLSLLGTVGDAMAGGAGPLTDLAGKISAELDVLNRSVQDRLAAAAELARTRAALQAAHDKFLQTVAPQVDDTSFNMTVALQSVAEKSDPQEIERMLSALADEELAAFEAMLRLAAEVNQLVGLLNEAATLPRPELIGPVVERYTASAVRIDKNLQAIDKVNPNPPLREAAAAIGAFGKGEAGLFELRRRVLGAEARSAAALQANRDLAQRLGADVETLLAAVRADTEAATAVSEAAIARGRTLLLAIAGGSLVVAFLIAWLYVGRNVVGRIAALGGSMRAIAGGNLEAPIPGAGRDEIADMAGALAVFRDTAVAVKAAEARAEEERLRAAEERRQEMLRLAERLEASVTAVAQQLGAAASQLQGTATAMTQAAATASERSGTAATAAEQASSNSQAVAEATDQLSGSIAEIARRVESSTEIATKAVDEAGRSDGAMRGLADAAQKIGAVVALINDIAAQTSLLALNATIEAARAGEAGKGFAVVASEVKSLATQTARATDDIASQIAAIQGATNDAVVAIRGIGSTIESINEVTTAIAAAVEEQGAATREIARNVQQAAAGTREVSTNIAEVTQAAGESSQAASQVLSAAADLARQSDTLRREVDAIVAAIRAG